MTSNTLSELLEILVDLRTEVTKHLPIGNSLIMFDLIFKIIISHQKNHCLAIKELFSELPHSEMGMRYHFRRLELRGWISIVKSENDKRTRYVMPTEKLLEKLDLLFIELKKNNISLTKVQ